MSAYSDNYKAIKWSPIEVKLPAAPPESRGAGPTYMPDIKEFVSPMSGRVISSRKQVRDEERGYGVRQCGELKNVSDFDNTKRSHERTNDRDIERAYRKALEQHPNIKFDD